MGVHKKASGRAVSIPHGLLTGMVVSVGWSILCAAITSMLVVNEIIPYETLGYCVLIILITASFVAAEVSYSKIKHRRVFITGCAGGMYFISLLMMNALFFGGQYRGVGVTVLAILGGAGASLLLGLRREGKRSQVKYKKRRV